MAAVRPLDAVAQTRRSRGGQRRLEVEVARLVVGRVDIGEIRGQQLIALRFERERLRVNAQITVERSSHAG